MCVCYIHIYIFYIYNIYIYTMILSYLYILVSHVYSFINITEFSCIYIYIYLQVFIYTYNLYIYIFVYLFINHLFICLFRFYTQAMFRQTYIPWMTQKLRNSVQCHRLFDHVPVARKEGRVIGFGPDFLEWLHSYPRSCIELRKSLTLCEKFQGSQGSGMVISLRWSLVRNSIHRSPMTGSIIATSDVIEMMGHDGTWVGVTIPK
jgi:hypothetical protein